MANGSRELTMAPTINDFKVDIPATDFEKSKRFYTALGFHMSEGWDGTGGHSKVKADYVPVEHVGDE
jgi:hypothetical protein